MPTKKRDGGRCSSDNELFLQAFEKPTQIYRYLSKRHVTNPLFLNRTLTYMKHRMSRSHKGRKNFKIDTMLKTRENKIRSDKANIMGDFITLNFMGFYDKSLRNRESSSSTSSHNDEDSSSGNSSSFCDENTVRVETILLKISHKKRKDSSSDIGQETISTIDVCVNPSQESLINKKFPVVKIPSESFTLISENQNKSFIIFLKVEQLPKIKNENVDNEDDEPLAKHLKPNVKFYGSELVIFDKHGRCALTVGEYDVALQEIKPTAKNASPKKLINWETIPDSGIEDLLDHDESPFNIFSKCPSLKFRLEWTNQSNDPDQSKFKNHLDSLDELTKDNQNNNNIEIHIPANITLKKSTEEEQVNIVYSFMYNNNSRQETEYTQVTICPWCGLNCRKLYALLKHLKSCHPRFNFTYVPMQADAARIDVTINDMYDGSYSGSPYDLIGPSMSRRHGTTTRRTVVTNLLVCRPRRPKANLNEFLELDENEINNQRPYITGHNRLYHHSETCLTMNPRDLDYDSGSEHDPLWLRHKTMQMIDEFTDVNEGEKELMQMWNLHVMKHGYVGDCQLPIACDMFLSLKGKELLQKNLYRNFILHSCSLFDFGLLSPESFHKLIEKLRGILSTYSEGQNMICQYRESQLNFWFKVGMQKQVMREKLQKEQQKLQKNKSPYKNESKTSSSRFSNEESKTNNTEMKKNLTEKSKTMNVKSKNSNSIISAGESSKTYIAKKTPSDVDIVIGQSNKRKLRDKSPHRRLSTSSITTEQQQKLKALKSRRRSVAALNSSRTIHSSIDKTASTLIPNKNNKK